MVYSLARLQKEHERLISIRDYCKAKLIDAPKGHLRVAKTSSGYQYFYRRENSPQDKNGHYIRKNEINLAKELAERDYHTAILAEVNRKISAIEKFQKNYNHKQLSDIYDSIHEYKRLLVTPLEISDEEYAEKWQSQTYTGKGFTETDKEFFTEKEERVRSKSEVIIADRLHRNNIPYHYEHPLYLKGYGNVYPDFMVLNKRTRQEYVWEHLGMMDNADYIKHALAKINNYEKNGILPGKNLIITHETSDYPLNAKTIQAFIDGYLI